MWESERPKHDAFHPTSIDPRDELSTERKSLVYDDVNWRECIDLERTEAVVRWLNPRAKYLIFEPAYVSDSDPSKPGIICAFKFLGGVPRFARVSWTGPRRYLKGLPMQRSRRLEIVQGTVSQSWEDDIDMTGGLVGKVFRPGNPLTRSSS